MDNEGYPTDDELELIKVWDIKNVFSLLDYIEERWAYNDWGFVKKWGIDKTFKTPVLFLELHTAGWSGNESIIHSLLDNWIFKAIFYAKWRRGGHYYFEINPETAGFKTVKKYCEENKVSRQYISKAKHKFDWIIISPNLRFIRHIN